MPEKQPFLMQFPNMSGTLETFHLHAGQYMFVLGGNGAGKSALMGKIYGQNHHRAKRISAHRQTWFTSNTLTETPASLLHLKKNISSQDGQNHSRWRDDYQGHRSQLSMFSLINSENQRARLITAAVDNNNTNLAREISAKESPIGTLNQLLRLSNIHIQITLGENDTLLASKNGSPKYSIAELSDGERNAILIAMDVLTAPENTLFVMDEPERHLHRAIISPLLSSLFSKRDDCAFIIATHDLNLPLDNPEASVLLVRECKWQNNEISGWETNLINSGLEIDYNIKRDILGQQPTLLFTEGTDSSLDQHIYNIVFPEANVVPQGSCIDVEKAVKGIRATTSLNWVNPIGLIDADNRTPESIARLRTENIYCLPCYSVEAIYYNLEIIKYIAQRQSTVTGTNPQAMIDAAKTAILNNIRTHKNRMCAKLCESKVKEMISPPTWTEIQTMPTFSQQIDIQALFNAEKAKLDTLIAAGDVDGLIQRYPIREAGIPNAVARALHFQERTHYESAVRKLLVDDEDIRNYVRGMFGDMLLAIAPPASAAALPVEQTAVA